MEGKGKGEGKEKPQGALWWGRASGPANAQQNAQPSRFNDISPWQNPCQKAVFRRFPARLKGEQQTKTLRAAPRHRRVLRHPTGPSGRSAVRWSGIDVAGTR
jgi:hypothetical protein